MESPRYIQNNKNLYLIYSNDSRESILYFLDSVVKNEKLNGSGFYSNLKIEYDRNGNQTNRALIFLTPYFASVLKSKGYVTEQGSKPVHRDLNFVKYGIEMDFKPDYPTLIVQIPDSVNRYDDEEDLDFVDRLRENIKTKMDVFFKFDVLKEEERDTCYGIYIPVSNRETGMRRNYLEIRFAPHITSEQMIVIKSFLNNSYWDTYEDEKQGCPIFYCSFKRNFKKDETATEKKSYQKQEKKPYYKHEARKHIVIPKK